MFSARLIVKTIVNRKHEYFLPDGVAPPGERSVMSKETCTMQTADTTPARAPEDAPALVKKIGKTTYKVRVHFSQTSIETMSDKIKHEIQQM